MNPTSRTPAPADDQPVTDLARRIGPPVAIGSLVTTVGLLAWMALAPTAIAGPLEEAPFTVPGTLVVPPDDGGCLGLVDGDGTAHEHCLDELVRSGGDEGHHSVDAHFDQRGRLLAVVHGEQGRRLLHVDAETGQVLETLEETELFDGDVAPPPAPNGGPHVPPPTRLVHTDGDRVLRADEGEGHPEADPVVLDLHGPPGYRLDQAELSPDGKWVVVLTGTGEVAVAPTDGSAAPHVWADVPDDRWLDLARGIRWDG